MKKNIRFFLGWAIFLGDETLPSYNNHFCLDHFLTNQYYGTKEFFILFFSWAHFQWWIFNQCFFRSCQVGCFGHGWNWQSIKSDDVKIRCFSHFSWCFPGSWRGMLIINISLLVIVKNLFETQLERHAMFVAFGFFRLQLQNNSPRPHACVSFAEVEVGTLFEINLWRCLVNGGSFIGFIRIHRVSKRFP